MSTAVTEDMLDWLQKKITARLSQYLTGQAD